MFRSFKINERIRERSSRMSSAAHFIRVSPLLILPTIMPYGRSGEFAGATRIDFCRFSIGLRDFSMRSFHLRRRCTHAQSVLCTRLGAHLHFSCSNFNFACALLLFMRN